MPIPAFPVTESIKSMAKLDPFSAQVVELVRSLSDEAILELVRNQLGAIGLSAPRKVAGAKRGPKPKMKPAAAAAAKPAKRIVKRRAQNAIKNRVVRAKVAPKVAKKRVVAKAKKRGGRRTSPDKVKLLATVERAVRTSKGLSASQIAAKTKLPQNRVAAAVRELKAAQRIFQGGDRRFARYAGDRDTANKASLSARTNAAGPKR